MSSTGVRRLPSVLARGFEGTSWHVLCPTRSVSLVSVTATSLQRHGAGGSEPGCDLNARELLSAAEASAVSGEREDQVEGARNRGAPAGENGPTYTYNGAGRLTGAHRSHPRGDHLRLGRGGAPGSPNSHCALGRFRVSSGPGMI